MPTISEGDAIMLKGSNASGTLGCFVTDGKKKYLMTNHHVLEDPKLKQLTIRSWVVNSQGETIATTVAGYRGVHNGTWVDWALAEISQGVTIKSLYQGYEFGAIDGAEQVVLRGAMTGTRKISVSDGAYLKVPGHLQDSVKTQAFEEPGLIEMMGGSGCRPGDSGSALTQEGKAIVGLLFGTNMGGYNDMACHIGPVLDSIIHEAYLSLKPL